MKTSVLALSPTNSLVSQAIGTGLPEIPVYKFLFLIKVGSRAAWIPIGT